MHSVVRVPRPAHLDTAYSSICHNGYRHISTHPAVLGMLLSKDYLSQKQEHVSAVTLLSTVSRLGLELKVQDGHHHQTKQAPHH